MVLGEPKRYFSFRALYLECLKLMLYLVSLIGEMNQKYKELKKREENMDSKCKSYRYE